MSKLPKCILLYSGGLDSIIAAKILLNQGIEVLGLHFILPYYPPDTDYENLKESINARNIGLKLIHYKCGNEYIDILKNPAHGYGKNVNPCIDCKIFFINKAIELMIKENADFIATGEVVGQRPMSQQKNTLIHIENSTIKGKLLRPLSAKLLNPTIPELEGTVDREQLFDISGRGRKRQLELAHKLGILNFSPPAGGCLFTDKFISARIIDLLKFQPDFNQSDLYVLKIGRHFRINPYLKIIVSRNEFETAELDKYENDGDYYFRPEFSGPSVSVKGILTDSDIKIINSIIFRYGKPSELENLISIYSKGSFYKCESAINSISDNILEKYRI